MSGFEFDKAGGFPSAADADDWAKRNKIELTDLEVTKNGRDESVQVAVRRDFEPEKPEDNHNRRKDTFFD